MRANQNFNAARGKFEVYCRVTTLKLLICSSPRCYLCVSSLILDNDVFESLVACIVKKSKKVWFGKSTGLCRAIDIYETLLNSHRFGPFGKSFGYVKHVTTKLHPNSVPVVHDPRVHCQKHPPLSFLNHPLPSGSPFYQPIIIATHMHNSRAIDVVKFVGGLECGICSADEGLAEIIKAMARMLLRSYGGACGIWLCRRNLKLCCIEEVAEGVLLG